MGGFTGSIGHDGRVGQTMRALKGLVIGMGVLIVIGLVVVVVALIERADGLDVGAPAQSAASPAQGASPAQSATSPAQSAASPARSAASPAQGAATTEKHAFGDVAVTLPPGAKVVATTTDAGRLIVHLRLADGTARVLVLDLATGKPLGAIRLAPAAAQ